MRVEIVPARWIESENRRLDCQPFTSGGFQSRMAVESLPCEKVPLKEVTLRGIEGIYHVGQEKIRWVDSSEYGVTFLRSSDILLSDLSNVSFISKKQVSKNSLFQFPQGTTLITRSGTIGKTAYAREEMIGMAASQDVLKVVPDEDKIRPGYLFAYLSSKHGLPQVASGTFGSIIVHIEAENIANLPVPRLGKEIEEKVHRWVAEASILRSKASRLLTETRQDFIDSAFAQVGTAQVDIVPLTPVPRDAISIRLSGEWSESCAPQNPTVSISNNQIRITTIRPSGACAAIISPFNFTTAVGQLSAGVYEVVATHLVEGMPREYGRKVFTVGGIGDGAFPLLAQRTTANRVSFHVYQDADSGFNHGFPSGFYGNARSKIHLDTGCVNDRTAANGCAPTGSTRLDRGRGTVLRISFDSLSLGEFVGVNFEEPENWGAQGRPPSRGYDLRGATEVVFEIRSPGGIRVQFGVGGRVTDFMTIAPSTEFTTLRISLNSLKDPDTGSVAPPDLSAVHLLFAVAANSDNTRNGGTVLLDNIRFEPVPTGQQGALSFPLANQTFGVVPVQNEVAGRVPIPPDQLLRNLTTAYESALTLLALLQRGTIEDLGNARLIAEAFHYALRHDNSGLPLPVAADGSHGLRNGYESGDLPLFNDQAGGAARAGDVRLAGFSANLCAPSVYCLVFDGATGGNNAFAMLALAAASQRLNKPDYLNDAEMIGRWVVDKLMDTSAAGFGGYFSGYEDKHPAPKPLITGKSVENNADLFAAFSVLALLAKQRGRMDEAAVWTARANIAGNFVMQMFDAMSGKFFAGTVPAGTAAGDGICPNGARRGNEVINTCDFLDSNSFTTLALAAAPRYRNQIDWRRPVQFMLDNFAQTVMAGGQEFRGFNIVKNPSAGPNGIAWEFTGQAVGVMRLVDGLYGETRFRATADLYLDRLRQARALAPFGDGQGLVAATIQNGDQLPPLEQCLSTPFQCIPQRVGLAATVWGIFAERDFNPLVWPWSAHSVSAASYSGAALARESIIASFGNNLATTTTMANAIPLPTNLGGSTVRVRDSAGVDRLAPLFFVSPTQINYLIPPQTATGEAVITITSGAGVPSINTAQIAAVAPGLFSANASGQGIAAAVALRIKTDGTQSYEPIVRFDAAQDKLVMIPIDLGPDGEQVLLILFGTGIRHHSGLAAVMATIGGAAAEALYAGPQGDFVGLDQVNLRIPRSLAGRGEVEVALRVDGVSTNFVRVGIK
jgi:uncharacterized protein (TIGR03437 family)